MKNRHKSREIALQILYSFHSNPKTIEEVFEDEMFSKTLEQNKDYAIQLINGCIENKEKIDNHISELSQNWDINRITLIDKIILSISIFEMLSNQKDIPSAVSINEAIELAKKFSNDKSSKFINGILDTFNKKYIVK